jgi:hypothetical protein
MTNRFPVGTKVQIKNPSMLGFVIQLDDEPGATGEYLHKILTEFGLCEEPGSNLVPAEESARRSVVPKLQNRERAS